MSKQLQSQTLVMDFCFKKVKIIVFPTARNRLSLTVAQCLRETEGKYVVPQTHMSEMTEMHLGSPFPCKFLPPRRAASILGLDPIKLRYHLVKCSCVEILVSLGSEISFWGGFQCMGVFDFACF